MKVARAKGLLRAQPRLLGLPRPNASERIRPAFSPCRVTKATWQSAAMRPDAPASQRIRAA